MEEETKPKKSILKKWLLLLIVALILIVIIAGCGNKKEETAPRPEQTKEAEEQIEVINYVVLREWKPNEDPKAIGMEILIAEEDVSKENIVNLVRSIGKDSKKALIKIYQDKEAWEGEKTGIYGEIYDKGYLVFYVKNLTDTGAYSGLNEIRWFQEIGELEDLFGESTEL